MSIEIYKTDSRAVFRASVIFIENFLNFIFFYFLHVKFILILLIF